PFDIHRATRREVLEPALKPCGTGHVFTSPDRFLLFAMELAATFRARGRHPPRRRIVRPPREDWPDDPGNDVTGLLDDHPVALADVLARDVVGIVQRRHRARRAAHEHGA